MSDEVTLEVTQVTENVTVETTAGDVVEVKVVATQGAAATVNVGTTATGAAGTNASVTNSGSTSAAVFNFTIPRGADGANGPNSVTSATTSDGTANLSLSNVSTATATVSGLLTAGHIHGNLAGTLYTHVRTGEAVSKGDPFYISGFHVGSSQPIAMKADASNAAKMPAVGVMDADYAINTSSANGIISGTLSSVDTNGFTVNSPIYVANGGGYSNTAGTIPQQIGITERANASTGAFIVTNSKVINSADIADASTVPVYNESTELYEEVAALYDEDGAVNAFDFNAEGTFYINNGSGEAGFNCSPSPINVTYEGISWRINNPITDGNYQYTQPTTTGTYAITANANGQPDKLTGGTISGTTTLNSTSYAFGSGAQTALKSNLDLFTLLTLQESDSGSYTANAGTAQATQDGDLISLSATTANQRPNVYRFRNWSRNPGNSGNANPVMPLKLASAGVIIHGGTTANGGNFRCGIGMINGASAVAADANATAGRGFGWRIAWNASTSKLEFNLWAHNGTTYSEGAGIDTGLGATNLDGFFNVIVCLAADGTVTANTWFGTNTALSVPSTTPTATLAGGPTSGTFANQGIPLWIAAAHSTNAPSGANTIIARVINRKLQVG